MKNIIIENRKYIRAIIRRLTGTDNEDLEQETYIKLWKNLPNYQEKGKLRAWIGVLTANLCRDWRMSKAQKASNLEINTDELENAALAEPVCDVLIDQKKRRKIILDAVDHLPKIYREVVILFEFREISLENIAKQLKIPVGTVKSRLYHARQILKEKLSFLIGENK